MELNLKWENNASFKNNEFNNLWDEINKNDLLIQNPGY